MKKNEGTSKETYVKPSVLATYKKEELEETFKTSATVTVGAGCGCGCGCGCS